MQQPGNESTEFSISKMEETAALKLVKMQRWKKNQGNSRNRKHKIEISEKDRQISELQRKNLILEETISKLKNDLIESQLDCIAEQQRHQVHNLNFLIESNRQLSEQNADLNAKLNEAEAEILLGKDVFRSWGGIWAPKEYR